MHILDLSTLAPNQEIDPNTYAILPELPELKKSIDKKIGVISVLAGSGDRASKDGIGANASFYYPRGLAIDQQTGILFVSDWNSNAIRKITPQGIQLYGFVV